MEKRMKRFANMKRLKQLNSFVKQGVIGKQIKFVAIT